MGVLHATSALGIRNSGSGIRSPWFRAGFLVRVPSAQSRASHPVLGSHEAAEDVAQVGALQARLLAVQQVQLRLRVQLELALLGQADQYVEAREHLLELGRGIRSTVQALLQQFGLGQVGRLTVEVQQAAVALPLQAPHLARHQGGASALEALLFHPQPGDIFHLQPLVRVGGTQGGEQVAEQAVVGARVLVQGQHSLDERVSMQAVLERIEADLLLALGSARPG